MPGDRPPPPPEVLGWVASRVHPRGRVTGVAPLAGGITAAMDRVTVESLQGPTEVVLRRWPEEGWTEGLPAREAAALTAVEGHRVPAPRLLAVDGDGAETGVRCTLTSLLPGEPDLAPANLASWVAQLATTHAAIHRVPVGTLPGRRERYAERHRSLDWLADPGLRAAARDAASGPLAEEIVLAHGDYQHFNVLWRDARLTGVVDWPSAGRGSRGSDVGHCRLNLAVLRDAGTAETYLTAYERAAGVRVDRRADLRALLCFDLEWRDFIPRQVAGRAPVDLAGMPDRVADTVRRALDGLE